MSDCMVFVVTALCEVRQRLSCVIPAEAGRQRAQRFRNHGLPPVRQRW